MVWFLQRLGLSSPAAPRTRAELPRRQLLVDKFGHRIVATTTGGGGSMRLDLAPCDAT